MTVLVDRPLWEWRGRRWAHMVSDHSYGELHRFAQALGKQRLAFQGDHYDVDDEMRAAALAAGARATDSRDLVRRLRSAGLRRRDPWVVLEHTPTSGAEVAGRLGLHSVERPLCVAAHRALLLIADPVELVVLRRSSETGVGLRGVPVLATARVDPVVPSRPGLEVHVWDEDPGRVLIELVLAR